MTAGRERTLAGVAVGAVMLAWLALILPLYYVPHLVVYWAETDAQLTFAQRLLLSLSSLVGRSFIVAAPLLLVTTAAVLRWRIRAGRRARGR